MQVRPCTKKSVYVCCASGTAMRFIRLAASNSRQRLGEMEKGILLIKSVYRRERQHAYERRRVLSSWS